MKMYCYKKCSTCKKAERFLHEHGVAVEVIDYTEHPLTKEQLKKYFERSGLDIKRFFNTSGNVYRDLALKDKMDTMSFDEKITLLSAHPMLVKRPLLVGKTFILVGFNEKQWDEVLKNK